ncbi:hypothetical protein [Frateuria sp. STR12]|uniref:hypothetical protein n=1 Tax=Frateuria hangzhouensis TaxID=2995589 RepID=UPI002260E417|nr:hypothetical protein [Frateuria sp. STR12]MCX7514914.1 hypothetical protein [Frateuria sp. STR12]
MAYATVEDGYTDQSTHVVRQHLVIERALELIQHRQWHAASTTYPTGETSVAFQARDGRVLCMLWFGPGWVGAASRLDRSEPLLLDADKELRGELRRLFGLRPEH